jgi:hypothetical protein
LKGEITLKCRHDFSAATRWVPLTNTIEETGSGSAQLSMNAQSSLKEEQDNRYLRDGHC